ncbi:hypothetical protein EDC94DRAFT_601678 [Helicostylum pulchrum]|uniref:Uncharacterized protein n=1 Tax=Helicostylum pulchrum TaxID=562976 RepID=A0ABP9XTS6_9FUNG|nr:hypothetical protein EDC94DRAFT_601678 [Helicostylum pulchrum]
MSLSENDGDNVFIRRFQQHQSKAKAQPAPQRTNNSSIPETAEEFSPAVSWPILLAVIPTLGAFVAGSAEIWSDFIMLVLILYYVYKWMTAPWAYYESARSRRIIHQHSSAEKTKAGLSNSREDEAYANRMQAEHQKRKLITAELRRHELAGLVWVIFSPIIAGYTLQYSRLLLSNVDRYISAFNVTVFTLAASIKPLSHVIVLLQERTLFLQSEALVTETQVQLLQSRLDLVEKELFGLRKAYATKKDLGQMTEEINPTLHQLAKTLKRFEKRDMNLRSWTEEQFTAIDLKVREFDQYICYRIEQDQRQQAHGMVVSLILLPLNISLWAAKRITLLLPVHHNSANLLASPPPHTHTHERPSARLNKPLTPPKPVSYSRNQMTSIMPDPNESSYSTEGSIAAFGR